VGVSPEFDFVFFSYLARNCLRRASREMRHFVLSETTPNSELNQSVSSGTLIDNRASSTMKTMKTL